MTSITIPASMKPSFGVVEQAAVCDEQGNVLGYYTPVRQPTAEDYERAIALVSTDEIERSLKSGPTRPFSEAIAELRQRSDR